MSAQAPLLVRMRPRWLQLRNQQALLLPGRSVGHISILSQTFNHIESTFRDPGSNVGIVAPTLGVAPAGPGRPPPLFSGFAEVQEPSYRHTSTIFPKPPLCANACASPASRRGIRRLIGSRKLPSRTSSANSRTFEASGRASTRVTVTVGFSLDISSGNTEA